ncbi:EAL domain-containing protein [Pontibacterium sp.]|uniref:EAL domain-containing protein n=2 Tax=Pontibacterium sp. TaxID=2036026 RepID=UPI00351986E7
MAADRKGALMLLIVPVLSSLLITLAVAAALFSYELEIRKELRRTALAQKAITLTEHLDQSFTDVNFALIDSANRPIECNTSQFLNAQRTLLTLPQISDLRYVDRFNNVRCNSWHSFDPPLKLDSPNSHKGLNFSGPLIIDEHPGPGFQLYRHHKDGGKVQAIIRTAWLKSEVKFFHNPLGYMAIIDSDSGVPLVINGKYSLPLAANGIQLPINEPQSHEGLLDNSRQHFTYAQPLLTQPQLSVIISQDLESLYLGIYRFNTEWLITGCAAFVLLVLVSFRVQRRIVDPIRQIKSALERNEFFNLYQPLVCSSSGRTVGCEVLMRWRHPFKGMLPPMTFIPLAEQSGLIKAMTLRQIDQTIRELGPVLQKDPHFKISFNICASHLTDHQTINGILDRAVFIPGMVLEITEHQVVEHTDEQIQQALQQLRSAGIKIAIDDFGTGYCGLNYLSSLPIDILKADRSFVAALGTDSINADVLSTIFDLTRKLGMSAIAEGVEREEQAIILSQMGFDLQQGWLHGYPMNGHDFVHLCNRMKSCPRQNLPVAEENCEQSCRQAAETEPA